MASSSPTAAWAHYYAKAGWRTFPVWAAKKSPIYEGWQSGATTDPDLIERYFSDTDRNMAAVCGEVFDCWDIEVEHVEAFAAWMVEHGYVLPEAPIASTGRGGIHILTAPTGVDGTRYLYLDGKHIGELKSRGGYILICPSVTEQMYRWTWLPERLAVQPAPEWLLGLVREPRKPAKGVPWRQVSLAPQSDIQPLVEALRASDDGDRNAMLHWAANRAYDDGISEEIAVSELMPPFMAIIQPGESEYERNHEGRATIASAYNR